MNGKAKERYEKLKGFRTPYINRALKCAKYTIPLTFPRETDNSNTDYETPYQSIGARGVNNIANKLMLALFPPNTPFFRLALGAEVNEVLKEDETTKNEWEDKLGVVERTVTTYMEKAQLRTTAYESLIQLVIAGNALIFLPPKEGGMKMYRLDKYVVSRDGLGNVLEIIAKDKLTWESLDDKLKEELKDYRQKDTKYKPIEIYTHTYLEEGVYKSYQEIEGKIIEGSMQEYPKDKSPWIALRLKKMDGEDYGRSFVDEYIGDLKVLETLSKSVAQVAAIASNILYLVNPNSLTRVSELTKAKSGDFIRGRIEDIQILQVNKTLDLQITQTAIQDIEQRLSYAFLLNSAVQRNAERVTAEEIRFVANELEDTVGAIYSILAREFQLPLVRRFLSQMEKDGLIPHLPQGSKGIEPLIITGIEALGRGHDLSKLDTFLRYAQVFPQAFQTSVKQGAILRQVATSLGIDATSVIKSDKEIQEEQQAMLAMQMQQQGKGM